jgi:hypothetical protein
MATRSFHRTSSTATMSHRYYSRAMRLRCELPKATTETAVHMEHAVFRETAAGTIRWFTTAKTDHLPPKGTEMRHSQKPSNCVFQFLLSGASARSIGGGKPGGTKQPSSSSIRQWDMWSIRHWNSCAASDKQRSAAYL